MADDTRPVKENQEVQLSKGLGNFFLILGLTVVETDDPEAVESGILFYLLNYFTKGHGRIVAVDDHHFR